MNKESKRLVRKEDKGEERVTEEKTYRKNGGNIIEGEIRRVSDSEEY